MLDARPKATLERGAVADIYRNSLSKIPSQFGRLVYLARLRSSNSGKYEHAGLAQIFGENEADKALRKQHVLIFQTWLDLSLSAQLDDLRSYLGSLESNRKLTLDTWQKLGPYRGLIPLNVVVPQKDLFLSNMRAMMRTLTAEVGLAWEDPIA